VDRSSQFFSSGDLIADRRYQHADDFRARGDHAAAADLFRQALERAPHFAAAWYALGDVQETLGDTAGAVASFERARAADPADRQGAGLRLSRLGAVDAAAAMSAGYVRAVFDQHAPDFDRALVQGLGYRGPQLLFDAVLAACATTGRAPHFDVALDLGCGTGLAGEMFRKHIGTLKGVDLSPQMLAMAERKGCYEHLQTGDMLEYLQAQSDSSAGLIVAADAFVYVADLAPLCLEAARVLEPQGFIAFTVETHADDGVVLGEKLRYAHGEAHVRSALAAAKLSPVTVSPASTRTEAGIPVPGLLVIATQ
jgi:predicted TPR repeat methyltransferase